MMQVNRLNQAASLPSPVDAKTIIMAANHNKRSRGPSAGRRGGFIRSGQGSGGGVYVNKAEPILTKLDFDEVLKEEEPEMKFSANLLVERQASMESVSSISTEIAYYDDSAFEKDEEEEYDEEDDDEDFTKASRSSKRPCVDTKLLDQMTAYWRSKGLLAKAQVDKLVTMAHTRKLYSEPHRIDAKLQELRRLLPGTDVVKLVSNAPNLLVYNIEASIPPKLAALKRLLPGLDVMKIIISSPHLLTFDIEKNIAPKVAKLRNLLPRADIVKILRAAPNLLSYDIEKTMSPKLQQLDELLPGADINKLISHAPTLLYHDAATSIAPKLRALQALLPGCNVVRMVESAPPLLCSDIQGSVSSKLDWIRHMVDGTFEEMNTKIEGNPRLLTCGYGVVFGRLEYMTKHEGIQKIEITKLRAILLAPVNKFAHDNPKYIQYLAQELVKENWCGGKTVQDLLHKGVKKLETEYGNYLRKIVNKR